MKTIISESFIKASRLVLEEIGFEKLSIAESAKDRKSTVELMVTLGLVGELKGHFVIRFSKKSALSFVKHLSGHLEILGEDPSELHYRKSAISEICNQIGGRAVALLSENGIDAMITLPTVIAGKSISASLPESDDKDFFKVKGNFGSFTCVLALKNSHSI